MFASDGNFAFDSPVQLLLAEYPSFVVQYFSQWSDHLTSPLEKQKHLVVEVSGPGYNLPAYLKFQLEVVHSQFERNSCEVWADPTEHQQLSEECPVSFIGLSFHEMSHQVGLLRTINCESACKNLHLNLLGEFPGKQPPWNPVRTFYAGLGVECGA